VRDLDNLNAFWRREEESSRKGGGGREKRDSQASFGGGGGTRRKATRCFSRRRSQREAVEKGDAKFVQKGGGKKKRVEAVRIFCSTEICGEPVRDAVAGRESP